jgi:hypothetical protein
MRPGQLVKEQKSGESGLLPVRVRGPRRSSGYIGPPCRNTMSYRADGLRAHLVDAEGDHPMVWDSQGSSGYQDLLEEADQ